MSDSRWSRELNRRVEPNTYRVEGETAFICMRGGYEAIIDAVDLPRATELHWSARVRNRLNKRTPVYVIRTGYFDQTLHRFILGTPKGTIIDHRNGNGLDNRRANLREASNQENMQNRVAPNRNSKTGVRGVSHAHMQGRDYWVARVWLGENHPTGKRSIMRYFPYTDDGLAEASQTVLEIRREYLPFSAEAAADEA